MKLTDREVLELNELISGAIDGRLTEPERARLERRLRESEEARRFYVRMMGLSSTLCAAAGRSEAEEAEDRSTPRGRPGHGFSVGGLRSGWGARSPRRPAGRTLATVAAVCLLGLSASSFLIWTRPGGVPPREEPGSMGKQETDVGRRNMVGGKSLAVLTRVVGALWEAADLPIEEGTTLQPSRLRLAAGWVQIEFFSGACVILEGPADLELISPERAFCRRGKLRTLVPSPAHGFTIGAPGVDAVDLGTEFGLRIDERGVGEVHVIDGEVELHGTGDRPATRDVMTLKAGRGASFGSADGLVEIKAVPAEFVDRARLHELEGAEKLRRHRRWRAHSEVLRADPATVLYYDFDGFSPWDRTLRNVGGRRDEALDGTIVGCLWSEGRWPGKGALEFRPVSDRVRINVPGRFDSLTLAAWVRVEGLDQWFTSLMLTDDYDPGEVHWQLSDKAELILSVKNVMNCRSPAVLGPEDFGRWVHLASVYDASAMVVTHYFDGKPVGRSELTTTLPLRIGAAEIGNWTTIGKLAHPIRSLNGRMDEFGIFARAMSGEEVRDMYESGKPGS